MTAGQIAAAVIVFAAVCLVASQVREARRYRARVPGLVRAAVALSEDEIRDLSDEGLGTFSDALEYARRQKRGVLREDPGFEAAFDRLVDEQVLRIQRDDAVRIAEDIARAEAERSQGRRDLGL